MMKHWYQNVSSARTHLCPRFASIYFSCAPENQGKPPGGQAAEAEKKEESAAVAKGRTASDGAGRDRGTMFV